MPLAVRELAAELLVATPQLAQEMADRLLVTIPELAAGDDELREETRASCESNIAQVLRLLKLGVGADAVVVPVEAAEWARGLVRRGITLPVLLRGYRLGHAYFWDRWSRALQDRVAAPEMLIAAGEQSSAFIFAYVDQVSDVLVGEYGTERERRMRSGEQLRAETVRSILAGETIDEEVAARRLGYELRRHHVALRVSSGGPELRGLERAAANVAGVLGPGDPLVVWSGVASLDVWCGSYDPFGAEAVAELEAYRPPDGIRVAVGAPGHGVSGFRRSHVEAVEATRVATMGRGPGGTVTSYARVELVSLLASDLPRARSW
jgi:hypothetical protein